MARAGDKPPVAALRHKPADQRAAGDCRRGGQAHQDSGRRSAEHRHQQREEMRDQPDLHEQPQRHRRREGEEATVAPERAARQAALYRHGRAGGGRQDLAILHLPQRLRCMGEHMVGQEPDRGHHDCTDDGCGNGKAPGRNGRDPQRRKDDTADAGAVIGHRQRCRPAQRVPRRDDGVHRRRTHRDPARAAQDRREQQLPGLARQCPSQHAERQQHRARLRDRRQAEAAIQRRQVGDDDGAHQEMQGDGGGHQHHRPVPCLAHRLEIDGRSIEAEPPSEHGEHEGGRDDAAAEERRGRSDACHAADSAAGRRAVVTAAAEAFPTVVPSEAPKGGSARDVEN